MCTFKNAAIALVALVLGLTFVFAGCEGGGDDGSSSNNGYTEDDSNGSGGEDTNGTLESGLIVATAPNDLSGKPFVGDFSFDGNVACTQVSVCEFETTGSVKVEFNHPLALFLNKYATANPDEDTQVVWDQPGDWGLAPNGTYLDEDGKEFQVETKVDDNTVSLVIHNSDEDGTPIQGNKLVYSGPEGSVEGTISDDLKTITKTIFVVASGEVHTRIFIRVE